jgi:hypothetical protein
MGLPAPSERGSLLGERLAAECQACGVGQLIPYPRLGLQFSRASISRLPVRRCRHPLAQRAHLAWKRRSRAKKLATAKYQLTSVTPAIPCWPWTCGWQLFVLSTGLVPGALRLGRCHALGLPPTPPLPAPSASPLGPPPPRAEIEAPSRSPRRSIRTKLADLVERD